MVCWLRGCVDVGVGVCLPSVRVCLCVCVCVCVSVRGEVGVVEGMPVDAR